MKTLKEIKKEIKKKYAAIPEKEIAIGLYLHSIGTKYITVLNTWNGTRLEKIKIEDFYKIHII